jgi:hypothetical protein
MAVVRITYQHKNRSRAKANIRYIMHRPEEKGKK